MSESILIDGFEFRILTPAEVRERAVAQWGEEKVAANERDVVARFGRNAPTDVYERVMGHTAARMIDGSRAETDPCQAGTVGCCIDHGEDRGGCQTW